VDAAVVLAACRKTQDLSGLLIGIRRVAIALILLLGYIYFRAAGRGVCAGRYRPDFLCRRRPVRAGHVRRHVLEAGDAGRRRGRLAGRFRRLAVHLLLPSFAKSGWIGSGFVEQGLFGIGWLKAQALFGLSGLDEISHSLWWSMLANIGCYVVVSLNSRPDASRPARRNALSMFSASTGRDADARSVARQGVGRRNLVGVARAFPRATSCPQQLAIYARARGAADWRSLPADAEFVHFAEAELAGAIGSASARVMVASVAQEEDLGLDEVLDILDEATQVRAYSGTGEQAQELEAATSELREANERLRELDRMKDDFISTVTHELRTPLTSIRAMSEMLHDDPRDGAV
jgi:hypothetical protein